MAETLVKVIGSTSSVVSLASGYKISGQATVYIPISKVQFDAALCADLATHITHSHITVYINGILQTASDMTNLVGSPISEQIKEHSDFQESILERHDPTGALPVTPADGAKYFSLATANGWTINRIYAWDAATSTYETIIPTVGMQVYIETDAMLYLWNGTALQTFSEGARVGAHFTGINLKAIANYTAVINGLSTDYFVPTELVFRMTAAGGAAVMNGDATILVGIGAGTGEILPLTSLVGLTVINTTFSIPIAGLVNTAITAAQTLHCRVNFADTSVGTASVELYVNGYVL